MSSVGICRAEKNEESVPYVIREGLFGATVNINEENLFLRMELITEDNTKNWTRFARMSDWIANSARGVLSSLVSVVKEFNYPEYEKIKEATGFTSDEYDLFREKAVSLKKRTNNKIVALLKANAAGSAFMITGFYLGKRKYVVYISRNPHFSIQDQSTDMTGAGFSLKNFINSYSDILISVGSDFSEKDSFYSRGISRNPHWVFEEKYSGLSMLLHGFTGAVADKYFPEKKIMKVMPVGSMQYIIKKHLLPGEGYVEDGNKRIDLTSIEVHPDDPEGGMNYIKISALTRIYFEKVNCSQDPTSDFWSLCNVS